MMRPPEEVQRLAQLVADRAQRDNFAAHALALFRFASADPEEVLVDAVADTCYRVADAMLERRKR